MNGATVVELPPGSPSAERPEEYLARAGPRRAQSALRAGIGLAAGLIAAGLAVAALVGSTSEVSPFQFVQPGQALAEVSTASPAALIFLGLLVMIALPVLRAVLVIPTFARSRDLLFAVLASLLWVLVLVSALLGLSLT